MQIIGKDGKVYETVKACMEADKAFDEAQAKEKALAETKKSALSARKKEKAAAIQKAEEEVSLAQAELDKAKEEAKKIIEEAQDKARALIKASSDKYKEASEFKYRAIADFNKEFGTYTTTYTGKKALEEYNRVTKQWNDFLEVILSSWF